MSSLFLAYSKNEAIYFAWSSLFRAGFQDEPIYFAWSSLFLAGFQDEPRCRATKKPHIMRSRHKNTKH